jgi:hypothetical protein
MGLQKQQTNGECATSSNMRAISMATGDISANISIYVSFIDASKSPTKTKL